MRYFAAMIIAGVLACSVVPAAYAVEQEISFVDPLSGVDSPTGWAPSDAEVNLLSTTWSLLGRTADVKAFGGYLSHRLERGLGVFSGEPDEIDGNEAIEVNFRSLPYLLNSYEVRSLFDHTSGYGYVEGAVVRGYLGNLNVYSETLAGIQAADNVKKGVNIVDLTNPIAIDRLVFAPAGNSASNFAVAKMSVTATPEPVSSALFLLGAGALATRLRKNKKAAKTA